MKKAILVLSASALPVLFCSGFLSSTDNRKLVVTATTEVLVAEYPGTVLPCRAQDVLAETDGLLQFVCTADQLRTRCFEEGQPIACIHPRGPQHEGTRRELKKSERQLLLKNRSHDALLLLYNKGRASAAELEADQFELEDMQMAVNELRTRVSRRPIVAPFGCRVRRLQARDSTMVRQGAQVFSLESCSCFVVEMLVPEATLPALRAGMVVSLKGAAVGGAMAGEITEIPDHVGAIPQNNGAFRRTSRSDASSGMKVASVPVSVTGSQRARGIVCGGSVYCTVALDTLVDVVAIPFDGVWFDSENASVFVMENKKRTKTAVTLGPVLDSTVVISSGIVPGDTITLGADGE